MGQSVTHVYNSVERNVYVGCDKIENGSFIGKGTHAEFKCNEGSEIFVQVFDSKERLIKRVRFNTDKDVSWIVRHDGIKQQLYGQSTSIEDPKGKFYKWDQDDEALFQERDRREEAREQERQRLAHRAMLEDRARQAREDERRRWELERIELHRIHQEEERRQEQLRTVERLQEEQERRRAEEKERKLAEEQERQRAEEQERQRAEEQERQRAKEQERLRMQEELQRAEQERRQELEEVQEREVELAHQQTQNFGQYTLREASTHISVAALDNDLDDALIQQLQLRATTDREGFSETHNSTIFQRQTSDCSYPSYNGIDLEAFPTDETLNCCILTIVHQCLTQNTLPSFLKASADFECVTRRASTRVNASNLIKTALETYKDKLNTRFEDLVKISREISIDPIPEFLQVTLINCLKFPKNWAARATITKLIRAERITSQEARSQLSINICKYSFEMTRISQEYVEQLLKILIPCLTPLITPNLLQGFINEIVRFYRAMSLSDGLQTGRTLIANLVEKACLLQVFSKGNPVPIEILNFLSDTSKSIDSCCFIDHLTDIYLESPSSPHVPLITSLLSKASPNAISAAALSKIIENVIDFSPESLDCSIYDNLMSLVANCGMHSATNVSDEVLSSISTKLESYLQPQSVLYIRVKTLTNLHHIIRAVLNEASEKEGNPRTCTFLKTLGDILETYFKPSSTRSQKTEIADQIYEMFNLLIIKGFNPNQDTTIQLLRLLNSSNSFPNYLLQLLSCVITQPGNTASYASSIIKLFSKNLEKFTDLVLQQKGPNSNNIPSYVAMFHGHVLNVFKLQIPERVISDMLIAYYTTETGIETRKLFMDSVINVINEPVETATIGSAVASSLLQQIDGLLLGVLGAWLENPVNNVMDNKRFWEFIKKYKQFERDDIGPISHILEQLILKISDNAPKNELKTFKTFSLRFVNFNLKNGSEAAAETGCQFLLKFITRFSTTSKELKESIDLVKLSFIQLKSREFSKLSFQVLSFVWKHHPRLQIDDCFAKIGEIMMTEQLPWSLPHCSFITHLVSRILTEENIQGHQGVVRKALNYLESDKNINQGVTVICKCIFSWQTCPPAFVGECLSVLAKLVKAVKHDILVEKYQKILHCIQPLYERNDTLKFFEKLSIIMFHLELRIGLVPENFKELNNCYNAVGLTPSSGISKYYKFTKMAYEERMSISSATTPPIPEGFTRAIVQDLWTTEWFHQNMEEVRDYFLDPKLKTTLTKRTKLIALCSLAQQDTQNAKRIFKLALELLRPPEMELNDNEIQNIEKLLQFVYSEDRALLRSVVHLMIDMHTANDDHQSADTLETILQKKDKDVDWAARRLLDLRTFNRALEKLRNMFQQTNQNLDSFWTDIAKKLRQAPHEIEFMVEFILLLNQNFDLQVTMDFPLRQWPQRLLHSYFVLTLGIQQDFSEFDHLWYSLLSFHDMFRNPKIQFFHQLLQATVGEHFERSIQNAYTFLLCLHIHPLPGNLANLSLSELKRIWLASFFQDPIPSTTNDEFWCNATNMSFMSNKSSDYIILYQMLDLLAHKGTVDEVTALLKFAYKYDFVPQSLKVVVESVSSADESLSTSEVKLQMELQIIEGLIDNLYAETSTGNAASTSVTCISYCKVLVQRLLRTECCSANELTQIIKCVDHWISSAPYDENEPNSDLKFLQLFAKILSIIYSFSLSGDVLKEALEIIYKSYSAEVLDLLNRLIRNSLPCQGPCTISVGQVPLENLMEEVKQSNQTDVFRNDKLLSDTKDIESVIEQLSELRVESHHLWEDDIPSWIKNNSITTCEDLSKCLSILVRAMELTFEFRVRTSQILSAIVLIRAHVQGDKGRLARVATGEGKSVIIALVAGYLGLKGFFVDIVTVSPLLAERDASEFGPFYDKLGLTSGDISGVQERNGKPKRCYGKKILYGDPSSFQGDLLRHEFSLLNTRGDRDFGVVIVDEVDSMLIDQGGYSTRLVDYMPAMEYLEPVYVEIWSVLSILADNIIQWESEWHFCEIIDNVDSREIIFDLIAKATEIHPNGAHLKEYLRTFVENACQEELSNHKEHFRNLVKCGALKLAGQVASTVSDEELETYIQSRWSLETPSSCLSIAQKYLKMRIQIHDLDESQGYILSPHFHPKDSLDESCETDPKLLILKIGQRFAKLQPIEDKATFLKTRIRESVTPNYCFYQNLSTSANKQLLPRHLQNLFHFKIDTWIETAIHAKYFVHENRDYIIKLDPETKEMKIVPVDFENTGVLQESSVWSDGLHQFLQIKHKLSISPEHFTTNYLSNLTFFKRYKQRILGLTGTLGSQAERDLLSSLYNVDTALLPTFKPSKHVYLQDIVAPNVDQWLEAIAISVEIHTEHSRAVLIVCKTIDNVDRIVEFLQNRRVFEKQNIRRYTRSDDKQELEFLSREISEKSVIVATNLAGRGTDIKISDIVKNNGGLHVCITFLPSNVRVEQQAAGRASRKGEPGSSQLILNSEVDRLTATSRESYLDTEELKRLRDEEEAKRIHNITRVTVPKIHREEEYFKEFCKIRKKYSNEIKDSIVRKYRLQALNERWGIILDMQKQDPSGLRTMEETDHRVSHEVDMEIQPLQDAQHKALLEKLKILQSSCEQIDNPYYHILTGNQFNLLAKYNQALNEFQEAGRVDPQFSAFAHYYGAFSEIKLHITDYQKKAIEKLNKTIKLIEDVHISSLSYILNLGPERKALRSVSCDGSESEAQDSEFTKQICSKITFFRAVIQSANESIKNIEEMKEVVAEMVGTEEYFQNTEKRLPASVVDEFRANGFCGFLKLEKRRTSPWLITTIIAVGVLQIIAAGALFYFSSGLSTKIAWDLLISGVVDIYTGIQRYRTGDYISWGGYITEKTILAVVMALGHGSIFLSSSTSIGTRLASTWGGKALFFLISKAPNWIVKPMNAILALKITPIVKRVLYAVRDLAVQVALTAFKLIRDAWKKFLPAKHTGNRQISSPSAIAQFEETTARSIQLVTRMIDQEISNAGLISFMHLNANPKLIEPITKALTVRLRSPLKGEILKLLKHSQPLKQFLNESKQCVDERWKEFCIKLEKCATEEFTTGTVVLGGSHSRNLVDYIKEVADEIRASLSSRDEDMKEMITRAANNFDGFKSYETLRDALYIYIRQSFTKTMEGLKLQSRRVRETQNVTEADLVIASTTFALATTNLAASLTTKLCSQTTNIIKIQILKPSQTFSVAQFVNQVTNTNGETKTTETEPTVHFDRQPFTTRVTEGYFKTPASAELLAILSLFLETVLEVYTADETGYYLETTVGTMGKRGRDLKIIRVLATETGYNQVNERKIHFDPVEIREDGKFQVSLVNQEHYSDSGGSKRRHVAYSLLNAIAFQLPDADALKNLTEFLIPYDHLFQDDYRVNIRPLVQANSQ